MSLLNLVPLCALNKRQLLHIPVGVQFLLNALISIAKNQIQVSKWDVEIMLKI